MKKERHAVTGGFGYSGKCIAKRLLDEGHEVRTLTNSYNRKFDRETEYSMGSH